MMLRGDIPTMLMSTTTSSTQLTCLCRKCGRIAFITLAGGDDGYEVQGVVGHCKHVVPEDTNALKTG